MSLGNKNERKKEIHKLESHYQTLNWITPKYREESMRLFPTSQDIDTVNNNQCKILSSSRSWKYSASQVDFLQVLINSSNSSRFSAPRSGLLTRSSLTLSSPRCRELVRFAHLFLKNSDEFPSLNTRYHVGLTIDCCSLFIFVSPPSEPGLFFTTQ